MENQDSFPSLSRRTILLAAAGAAPLLVLSSTGANAAKLSKTAVSYQDSPKDGKQCDGCALFEPPSSCKSVEGVISPKAWCKLWVKKAG